MKRLLLTGPVRGLDRYAEGARSAGWEPVAVPLLDVKTRSLDGAVLAGRAPDWVTVTSANALPALTALREQLVGVPFGCVGARTGERLRQLGFRLGVAPARSAAELARALEAAVTAARRPATRVLWIRGNLATELGEALSHAGFAVSDPVGYETRPRADVGELPSSEAVFFASPSAVQRYFELVRFVGPEGPCALAIGQTTLRALRRRPAGHFKALVALPSPTPEALATLLARLTDSDSIP